MRISASARITVVSLALGLVLPCATALADPGHPHDRSAGPHPRPREEFPSLTEPYSFDGSGKGGAHDPRGAAGTRLLRMAGAAYGDGANSAAGATRPSPRVISNALSTQTSSIVNDRGLSDFVYVWGQFLDHDIDLSESGATESLPIAVPAGDSWFDPASTGVKTIGLKRSVVAAGTGTSSANPRQQVNSVTAFIDGSQVYGSSKARADALRTFDGGLMRTSAGNMLPFNTSGLANANDAHVMPDSRLYLAGDVRANENPDLISLQTLFMREHNRMAAEQAAAHPSWSDEQLFQAARRVVIAELQAVTYNEFLPALLGRQAIRPYSGYHSEVNPSIANEFSTGAFRFGHSLLDSEISRLNDDGSQAGESISLAHAFFNSGVFDPSAPNHAGDIDVFLKAAASGNAQEVDLSVVDELRNMLFGAPGSGGLDLAALNIQRGRDHGLADYNSVRDAYGLPRVTSFREITSDGRVQRQLQELYGSVDNIDLWVGGLAERHVPNSSVGPLFQRIMVDQFTRLRDGDRLWYQSTLRGEQLGDIEGTRLSDVIRRNTALTNLQPNVFTWRG